MLILTIFSQKSASLDNFPLLKVTNMGIFFHNFFAGGGKIDFCGRIFTDVLSMHKLYFDAPRELYRITECPYMDEQNVPWCSWISWMSIDAQVVPWCIKRPLKQLDVMDFYKWSSFSMMHQRILTIYPMPRQLPISMGKF